MRLLSGVQSSRKLHLGNYLGALRQFVRDQDEADEALYFIADLDALATVRHPGRFNALGRRRRIEGERHVGSAPKLLRPALLRSPGQ